MKKDLKHLKHIGENIRTARKSKNLTIDKLSELIGVSESFLGTVERGKSKIGLENLIKLCHILEVSSDSLILEGSRPEVIQSAKLETLNIMLKNSSNDEIQFLIEYVNLCHDKQIFKKN